MATKTLLGRITTTFTLFTGGIITLSGFGIYYEKEKFYEKYITTAVRKLDPELAHRLTVLWLKYGLVPTSKYVDTPILAQRIKHLSFRNPVGIAAGFDKHGEAVESLQKTGFGFIEIGSVTPEPQDGNEKPRVFRLPEDKAIINRYGFNSDGYNVVYERLKILREKKTLTSSLLGVNLGKNKTSVDAIDDYVRGINKFADVVDYFVINISSPNTTGLRDLQNKDNLRTLLEAVISARDNLSINPKPLVFVKIAPDLNDKQKKEIAAVVLNKKCLIDGLIISNTTVERNPGLINAHSKETGGLSGAPLKNQSTKIISEMYKLTKGTIPIIGVGGIFSAEDAYEKIKAGASLVQIYSSFVYKGPPIVKNIKQGLDTLVKKDFYGNITNAVGTGLNK